MKLDERQVRMLREMGLDDWPWPATEAAATNLEFSALEQSLKEQTRFSTPPPQPFSPREIQTPSASDLPPSAAAINTPIPVVADAQVANMDWATLEARVTHCKACALCQRRKNTVFGVGHRQAQWMIVGEAPGENEDLQGEPFVGQAGRLLDQMLKAIGLSRTESQDPTSAVFIANVLKCRPPANRNPDPAEIALCQPYLFRQINLVQPRLILAMGRFAAQTLLQSHAPIGRLRGQIHRYQNIPVIVSYHPAYLLRSLTEKAKAWSDLCLAFDVFHSSTT